MLFDIPFALNMVQKEDDFQLVDTISPSSALIFSLSSPLLAAEDLPRRWFLPFQPAGEL